jgi:hypothetical protein
MNATDLFELTEKNRGLLPNSESYWSTLFSFYLLHLSTARIANKLITTWFCTNQGPHYFKRKAASAYLSVEGLTSKDIAVEPTKSLKGIWRSSKIDKNDYFTGISPDIIFKIAQTTGKDRYVLIENKVKAGADLNSNQKTSYPDLIKQLSKEKIDCSLFLLQSLGADKIYESAMTLQEDFSQSNNFGVILWEDVIRCMKRDGFIIAGIDFDAWQPYTEDGKADCKDWD